MKKLLITLLLLPISISAQQHPGMGMDGQPDMKKMMQMMQKMQKCMAKIDKNEIAKITKKSIAFAEEIKALCVKGKRNQAEKKANIFGKIMINNKTSKKLQKCSKIMINMVPETIMDSAHVCDMPQDSMNAPPMFN